MTRNTLNFCLILSDVWQIKLLEKRMRSYLIKGQLLLIYVLKGRKSIKYVLWKDVTCNRYLVRPIVVLERADMPNFWVNICHSFRITSSDFAGPKFNRTTDKNVASKACILLLSCATFRVIYLKLVPDVTVSVFILAFKRLTSKQGIPYKITGENSKSFRR